MAICKMCHKSIPEGMDFCEECENKRTNQADESYLDSLLSSVTEDHSEKAADFYSRQSFVPSFDKINKAIASDEIIAPETEEIITDTADEGIEEVGKIAEDSAESIEYIP